MNGVPDEMLTIRPAALLAHLRQHGARGQEHAEHVHVEHLPPLVDVDLLERLRHERGVDAGVVDEPVDAAEAVEHGLRHRRAVGLGRDVDAQPERVAAVRGQLGRCLLGAAEVGDHDPRALVREAVGDRPADALRAAGDDATRSCSLIGRTADRRPRRGRQDPAVLRVDQRLQLLDERLPGRARRPARARRRARSAKSS